MKYELLNASVDSLIRRVDRLRIVFSADKKNFLEISVRLETYFAVGWFDRNTQMEEKKSNANFMSTAKDYVKYLDVDISREVLALKQTVNEVLMRLDEKRIMLDMVKKENTVSEELLETILADKAGIMELSGRIDAMETFISRVHQDMNDLERELLQAELNFPDKAENALKTLLKPILQRITPDSDQSNFVGTSGEYEKVEVFKTDDFFHSK